MIYIYLNNIIKNYLSTYYFFSFLKMKSIHLLDHLN